MIKPTIITQVSVAFALTLLQHSRGVEGSGVTAMIFVMVALTFGGRGLIFYRQGRLDAMAISRNVDPGVHFGCHLQNRK
jgi:hypothetical protein